MLEPIERTMLLTTHDLPLAAQFCDRALILADGRIVCDGPTDEVLADADALRRYDLELPAGFELAALAKRRGRRAMAASG